MLTFFARLSSHPRRTLIAALVFVAVAGVIGGPLAGSLKSSGGFVPGSSQSAAATRQLQAASGLEPSPGVVLLVATPQGARADAARIAGVGARLARIPGVARVSAPNATARDGRHVLVTAVLRSSADDGATAKAAVSALAGTAGVTVGGDAVANEQIGGSVTKDLGFAELLAFPLLVALSLLFFRGRAALMPLAVGMTTVLGTFLVLSGVNQVYGLSVFALNLVIGLGLGLAIDYTLFLVTRFREELARGQATRAAIATTVTHAGRTIAFSATTVACALATLVLFPQGFLKSMGIAGATVAIVAALAALTISPALLAIWGPKLARGHGRAGSAGADPAQSAAASRWSRFARAVMRRPGTVAAVTAVAMLTAAAPALSVVWSPIDSRVIPQGQSSRTVADAIGSQFAGAGKSPVTVAVTAPRADGAAVAGYARRVGSLAGVTGVDRPRALDSTTWQLDAGVSGGSADATAQRVVGEIRGLRAPFPARVTGAAASFVDQQAAIGSHLPLAVGLLAVLTFLVLWLMTDSVILPLKAIAMNALTVGAALAPLVLIYQHGRLTRLLGYTANGGVEPTDFLVTATLVFALSTDYGVFLLGRIKEFRDSALADPAGSAAGSGAAREREAVAAGLGATGRVVTAAAILLAVAIGAFSTSSVSFIQQIGVATATGVLLDAFIVRALLVPSLMALLGRWNWWSPRAVHRLRARIVGGRRATAAPTWTPGPAGTV
jgi:uncharacterized membrane protein YdfJ with MMPL/SSD domain